jgi:hypothetical protein
MKNFKNYAVSTNRPGKAPLLDRITESYLKGEELALTDEENTILSRWKVVRMLEFQHRPCVSYTDIKKILMRDFGISEVTAHKDITDAHKLFGSVQKVNREFKLMMYMEWQEQLASLCEVRGDPEGASKALERAAAILDKLKVDDPDAGGDKFYQLNMFFGAGDEMSRKTIDLDRVDEIPATEFKEIMKVVDHPRVDLGMMEILLENHSKRDEGSTD